jgi:hypothetical protein
VTDPRARRPPNRLDEEGHRQVAGTWESLVDRQIRDAIVPWAAVIELARDDEAAGAG